MSAPFCASRELSRQLTRREKRIAVVESLNSSLVFFTQHIKKPISDLLSMAEKMGGGARRDPAEVEKLLELTRKEGREILATLKGLEDEVAELQGRGEKLKKGDLSVDDLEKKLRRHLRDWKKRQVKLDDDGMIVEEDPRETVAGEERER